MARRRACVRTTCARRRNAAAAGVTAPDRSTVGWSRAGWPWWTAIARCCAQDGRASLGRAAAPSTIPRSRAR